MPLPGASRLALCAPAVMIVQPRHAAERLHIHPCLNVAMTSNKPSNWDEDFGSDDETSGRELEREWDSRRQDFWNSGYREGLEAGKQEAVQGGFNAGYIKGTAAGYAWGAACGAAAALAAFSSKHPAAQLDAGSLQSAVSSPFKHVSEAVVGHVMADDASGAAQANDEQQGQETGGGSNRGGQGGRVLPRPAQSYEGLQQRQQRVVSELQEKLGMRLQLERSQHD